MRVKLSQNRRVWRCRINATQPFVHVCLRMGLGDKKSVFKERPECVSVACDAYGEGLGAWGQGV